jgi:hypothetical protein
MTGELNLRVCNPSDYERAGFVTMHCQELLDSGAVQPGELDRLALHDTQGNPVAFQIDPIATKKLDPQNLSRAVLAFHVPKRLPPGRDDYSSDSGYVVKVSDRPSVRPVLDDRLKIGKVEVEGFPIQQVELINSQLVVSFDLRPWSDPKDVTGTWWYSGSATSVRREGQEMLAIWNCRDWMEHDREKRCMQIDRVRVERHPDVETSTPQEFSLFDRPYELISESSGPVRVSITIASVPFDYGCYDWSTKRCCLECRLFRVISLYANADYVLEELFVEGRPNGPDCGSKTPDLSFSAHYFACMDMGKNPQTYQFGGVPDWFAVGRPEGYYRPGYGFACDAHVCGPLKRPAPDYHDTEKAHKTFSWQLRPCTKATCLHLLMNGAPGGFDGWTGHSWYEVVYKPLKARL